MSGEPRIGRWRTAAEEMLLQRQLRAAEIALENDRRRRADITQAQWFKAAAAEAEAARERDAEAFGVQLAEARRRELAAEQRAMAERTRRLGVEQQLAALEHAVAERDDVTRQLAAEARIRRLEGELELVMQRAAAFEYGVRMAAFDAFALVREMTDRVGALLTRAGLLPTSSSGTPGQPGEDVVAAPPAADSGFDAARLDAALERLRAATPAPEQPE